MRRDIAAAPAADAEGQVGLLNQVQAYIGRAKAVSAGGLTWAEFGELMTGLLRLTVTALDAVSSLTGPEKKALAMEAVAALFDQVADRTIPAIAWPLWLPLRSRVRSIVLSIAEGAIEQLIPLVRSAAT